jgi:hypothetical protein
MLIQKVTVLSFPRGIFLVLVACQQTASFWFGRYNATGKFLLEIGYNERLLHETNKVMNGYFEF